MVGIFSFVRFFQKKEWILTIAVVAMIFLEVWFDLEIPLYMADITDVITSHGTTDEVLSKSFAMVGCAVASLLVGLIISVTVGWISSSVAKTIREQEFEHVQKFSMTEIDRISSYSLITRSTNDVKQIQDFIGIALESLIRAPIVSVWAILRISTSNMTWTAVTMVCIVAMVILIMTILRLSAPLYRKVQKLNDGLNSVTMEMVTGQRVIRAYDAQDLEKERFDRANSALYENNIKANHVMAASVPFNGLIRNSLTMAIYWLGAFIIAGTASEADRLTLFGDMIVFATYATMVLNGFRMLVQIFNVFPRAKVSMERVYEVLDMEPQIVSGSERGGNGAGSVRFKDVQFRYPSSPSDALRGISFHVDPGETVAIIGATGCGKTTLVNLIPRFYDPEKGSIEVDGVDIRDYDLDTLRGKIGFVPQRATILSGSVRDNVNYGMGSKERSDDDVWRALDVACAKDFIEAGGGLDASLTEEGKNLSGGQKQRITIARAVCRRPEIFIFDDCFSAIDYRTDLEVRSRLRRETKDAAVILVTQRIGTARTADRIIVMDDGTIAEQGTHEELMRRCSIYQEIADSQRTGGEEDG
jgi:ATP-binding cassette subfamily B protein